MLSNKYEKEMINLKIMIIASNDYCFKGICNRLSSLNIVIEKERPEYRRANSPAEIIDIVDEERFDLIIYDRDYSIGIGPIIKDLGIICKSQTPVIVCDTTRNSDIRQAYIDIGVTAIITGAGIILDDLISAIKSAKNGQKGLVIC